MRINTYILCCFFGLIKTVDAQDFASAKIPAELRLNAEIVIRDEQREIKVHSKTKVIEDYKIVFTVLNKQGDYFATVSENYDKNTSLKNLKVNVYDSLGIKTKSYSKGDFQDQSLISGSTMYADDRVTYLDVSKNIYPYTIEFSYTKTYNSNFYIPLWSPQFHYNVAVEQSNFSISYPEDLPFKFKESNMSKAVTSSEEGFTTKRYSCKNLSAIEYEYLSTGFGDLTPWVNFSPKDFSFEDTVGDMSTWRSFGNWVYQLSKDGDQLPPEIASKVHELTDGLASPEEKVKKLYNYMQSKTRYISVQLGIGGFKPFPAEKVAVNNYGDCKALSNYMKALLKEAQIPSQLVIVKAGKNKDLWADFSAIGQANHMILCVPMVKDTVWLECTSQRNPYNYLGSFTGDRNVVLVSDEGGKVVKTPKLNPKDNFQVRKAKIVLDANGNAVCNISTKFGGEQFEHYHDQLFEEVKEQKDFIYKNIGIKNPQITSLNYSQEDQNMPLLEQALNLNATKMMTGLGDNFFLSLNLMNKIEHIPQTYKDRKTQFAIGFSFYNKDEISYEVPAGFRIDFLPEDQEIKSVFGVYKTKTTKENNVIIYTRELEMWKKTYEPDKYNELIEFYNSVYKADKRKAVIVKI